MQTQQLFLGQNAKPLPALPRIRLCHPSPAPRASDAAPRIAPLAKGRLDAAKRSYATRRFALADGAGLLTGEVQPESGDLVLARIEELGHHRRLESPEGRRRHLYPGDEVLLCYGARYASDQFEALVPESLEPCHMVAAGGIAAACVIRHSATKPATRITPLGLVTDAAGQALNLKRYALEPSASPASRPYCIAVVGTSMNAGKTTTIAGLTRGLARRGLKVAVGKVTGTGAGGDRWAYSDAGAAQVLDFTDFGYASTYKVPGETLDGLLETMARTLAQAAPDILVIELADGLFFSETAELVRSQAFADQVDDVIVAASDAMGAEAGARWLKENAMAPLALAGRMTASPLAVREAERSLATPIVSLAALMEGTWQPPRLQKPARISG